MLILEIEWLIGVARLAGDPSDVEPDWPPQPDRIFSALVASWGALGEPEDGRAVLEWLERQAPPRLFCCEPTATRPVVDVYVPVNDPKGLTQLPALRLKQPRTFHEAVLTPAVPHLRLIWDAVPDDDMMRALSVLAEHTSYVGHSASLARMVVYNTGSLSADAHLIESAVSASPHKGRLAHLCALFERHIAGDSRARPRPAPVQIRAVKTEKPPQSVFSPDWYVLSHAGGDRPDIFAAAVVARRLRDALMSALPQPVPAWFSGHDEDRAPTRDPHTSIQPLGFVGGDHATGRLMGLAIILPRTLRESWDDSSPEVWKARRAFEGALSGLMNERGTIALKLGRAGVWELALELTPPAAGKASLRPQRYHGAARRWASVTPIALDRHLKSNDWRSEAADIVAKSCRNIGLPDPEQVICTKHSAVKGSPSAWPPGGAPKNPTWARPSFLKGRKLVHAQISFAGPVEGPVILGAGRFAGLGLCLPLRDNDHD